MGIREFEEVAGKGNLVDDAATQGEMEQQLAAALYATTQGDIALGRRSVEVLLIIVGGLDGLDGLGAQKCGGG